MLSKPLTSWLLDEASDARAVEVIAKSEILRSEAAMALPALRQAALRPATNDEIKAIIASRFPTYPQPKRTEGEAAAFWADYFDALSGLTPAQVEGGMAAHVRDPKAEFLPKPGKLADLARSTENVGRWTRAHNRARAAVEQSRKIAAPVVEEPKPDPAVVQAMVADTLAKLSEQDMLRAAAKKAKRQPTPSAPIDHTGMSPEARRLLESQGTIRARAQNDDSHPDDQEQAA